VLFHLQLRCHERLVERTGRIVVGGGAHKPGRSSAKREPGNDGFERRHCWVRNSAKWTRPCGHCVFRKTSNEQPRAKGAVAAQDIPGTALLPLLSATSHRNRQDKESQKRIIVILEGATLETTKVRLFAFFPPSDTIAGLIRSARPTRLSCSTAMTTKISSKNTTWTWPTTDPILRTKYVPNLSSSHFSLGLTNPRPSHPVSPHTPRQPAQQGRIAASLRAHGQERPDRGQPAHTYSSHVQALCWPDGYVCDNCAVAQSFFIFILIGYYLCIFLNSSIAAQAQHPRDKRAREAAQSHQEPHH